MLMRRFTIVCLLMTLFGMGLSVLVAQANRSTRSWEQGMTRLCSNDRTCITSFRP